MSTGTNAHGPKRSFIWAKVRGLGLGVGVGFGVDVGEGSGEAVIVGLRIIDLDANSRPIPEAIRISPTIKIWRILRIRFIFCPVPPVFASMMILSNYYLNFVNKVYN